MEKGSIMKIKNLIINIFIIVLLSGSLYSFDGALMMKAMRDEIHRSLDSLEVNGLKKPYYIEYTLSDDYSRTIKAQLGSIIESSSDENARLGVGVRVGNYRSEEH
ncbi:MAG: PmbA TldD protein, partial [Bacteroidota bacterium]|nr:PmbA TldD protein [Bacteroidota bacterium]